MEKSSLYREGLRALEEELKRPVRPSDLVAVAENKRHRLYQVFHNCFEWDDEIAGHKHRLQQARTLIAKIKVRWEVDGKPVTAREWVSVTTREATKDEIKKAHGYVQIVDAVRSIGFRRQMIEQAIKDLLAWKNRNIMIDEVKVAFDLIDMAISRINEAVLGGELRRKAK